jgi:hypothetical protein
MPGSDQWITEQRADPGEEKKSDNNFSRLIETKNVRPKFAAA